MAHSHVVYENVLFMPIYTGMLCFGLFLLYSISQDIFSEQTCKGNPKTKSLVSPFGLTFFVIINVIASAIASPLNKT